jgi:hypothetical protein
MVDNIEAWKGLTLTLDDHKGALNTQLKMKNINPDSDSPLLGPLRCYSE